MPGDLDPERYGHCAGYVDLKVSRDCFFTCGADGDLRIWRNADDEPVSIVVGKTASALAVVEGDIFCATDENMVKAFNFDGDELGMVTRFTASGTCLSAVVGGKWLACGSNDFTVKLVELGERSNQRTFSGHEAPILFAATDPTEQYLASSSCDGTVRIWDISTGICVKVLNILPKSNRFEASKTNGIFSWSSTSGKIFIPCAGEVRAYVRQVWDLQTSLKCPAVGADEHFNVVQASPCERFVAGGTSAGHVCVWRLGDPSGAELVNSWRHIQETGICGLAWFTHHTEQVLLYVDCEGQFDQIVRPCQPQGAKKKDSPRAADPMEEEDDLLDLIDNLDGADSRQSSRAARAAGAAASGFIDSGAEEESDAAAAADDGGEDDDDMTAQFRKRKSAAARAAARLADDDDDIADDDDGQSASGFDALSDMAGADNAEDLLSIGDDEKKSTADGDVGASVVPPQPTVVLTEPQPPFQPSSTPVYLSNRFMVYNSVGIVRQYRNGDESTIDVEFHDTSIHPPITLANHRHHTMATLSQQTLALASPADAESATPSVLEVITFGVSDTQKEWSQTMPARESIVGMATGRGWLAVVTDRPLLRLFSSAGVQLQVVALPGPLVCAAGRENLLVVVYHAGQALPDQQNQIVMLLEVGRSLRNLLPAGAPLPLAHKSRLVWLGFTEELSLCFADSSGLVSLLNRRTGGIWFPIIDFSTKVKSVVDHYWLVSVGESPCQLRCIHCRAATYPSTVPRPALQLIQPEIPLCEPTVEKSQIEETFWRAHLFGQLGSLDEEDVAALKMTQQESLVKLFALASKANRDQRALQVCELIDTEPVLQLAVRYASRLRKTHLAERVAQLALSLDNQHPPPPAAAAVDGHDQLFGSVIPRRQTTVQPQPALRNRHDDDSDVLIEDDGGQLGGQSAAQTSEDNEPAAFDSLFRSTPSNTANSPDLPGSEVRRRAVAFVRRNPFAVTSPERHSTARGSSVFDELRPKKVARLTKPTDKKAVKRSNAVMSLNKENQSMASGQQHQVKQQQKKSFQDWLKDDRPRLEMENPGVDSASLIKIAMAEYKQMNSSEVTTQQKLADFSFSRS